MPTLQEYRLQFAKDMGALGPTPTGGVATDGTASTLVQASWPVRSRIAKDNLYEGWYLLRPEAGDVEDLVRQIPEGGYHPDTGTIDADDDYTTPPAADEVYELHGHDFEPQYELRDILNEALKLIYIPVQQVYRIPYDLLSPAGSRVYNLTSGVGLSTVNEQLSELINPGLVLALDLLPSERVEVQRITFTGTAASGSFGIAYRGQAHTPFAYNASAAAIQTAIRTIPGLEEATSTGTVTAGPIEITMTGAPLHSAFIYQATNSLLTAGAVAVTSSVSFVTSTGATDAQKATLWQNGLDVIAQLDNPLRLTDRLYVKYLVRAYDWCRVNESPGAPENLWGSRAGLLLDDDEAQPSLEYVSVAAQLIGWKRSPRVMEEATEHRRTLGQADAQQEFDAYQAAYLKSATRSPLLTYDVDGEMLDLKLPFSLGGAIPGPAARALANAPGFITPSPTV